jgi:hypothetical protein
MKCGKVNKGICGMKGGLYNQFFTGPDAGSAPSNVPVNTSLPTFSGTMWAGQTLTGLDGSWTNSPTSYTYRWFSNGVAIGGATASTFILTSAQDGTTITFGVIAINAAGSSVEGVSAGTAMHEFVNSSGQIVVARSGDSTALGSNNSEGPSTIDVTNEGYYYRASDDTIQPLTTGDMPDAVTGSMYPGFIHAHFLRTGRKVIVSGLPVGGTKFFGDMGGGWGEAVSSNYTASVANAEAARVKAGVDKISIVISSLGVNDQKSGDSLASVNTAVATYADKLIASFPYARILHWISGFEGTNNARGGKVRGYQREASIAKSRFELCGQNLMFNTAGLYSADQIHLSQAGQDMQGQNVDRYLALDTSVYTDRRARTIINSMYTDLSSGRKAKINTLAVNLGTVLDDVISMAFCVMPTKVDVQTGWGLIGMLTDDGFDFNADANITTDPTGSKAARIAISSAVCDYRYTYTNIGFVARTLDRKGAFGTSTKYLFGVSTGSSVFGVAETSTGVIQYFGWDNNTAFTGSGGIADNTRYAVERDGADKRAVVNGSVVGTTTVAAGAESTAGIEVGGRYTAGPTLFLNTEFAYVAMYKASTFNRSLFDSEMETLLSGW